MANTVPFYRIYLEEPLRKHLGINLKRNKIYFFTIKDVAYLSTDAVPRVADFKILKARVGYYYWFVDIPQHLMSYPPNYKNHLLMNSRLKVIKITNKLKNENNKKIIKRRFKNGRTSFKPKT